jgi:AraC-like DNA-binding protein
MPKSIYFFGDSPDMTVDPLAEIVTLLQPAIRFSKLVEGAGSWKVHRTGLGGPFYCAVLEGSCRMVLDGQPPILLQANDFVLVPAIHDLVIESANASPKQTIAMPIEVGAGHFRLGVAADAADVRMRVGHCTFGSPDAGLLVSLLPQIVIARDEPRLALLMQLVGEETRAQRPACELVLERLLEVLLIEALRCRGETVYAPGLAQGLADNRVAAALRALHAHPERPWTVVELAAEASLSRSAFFARFSRTVGIPPMEYLLAWRMALARRLLCERELGVDQIADRVGYSSASTFTVAFARHAGVSPARYGRTHSPLRH